MKEIVTSWFLLAVMVVLFFVNSHTLSGVSEDMCSDIEMLGKIIQEENTSKGESEIKKLRQKWKEDCKKLFHIFPHTYLEDIERLIIMTEVHIRNNEPNDAVLRLEEIKHRIKTLEENEKITLDNIF